MLAFELAKMSFREMIKKQTKKTFDVWKVFALYLSHKIIMMDVKEKIQIKAHELFIRQGLRSVTMDHLAQSLGMSKRTIYENYEDKRALVEEDAKYFYHLIKNETDRIIHAAENAIYGLMKTVQYIAGVVQQVNPLYFSEMRKYYSSAYKGMAEMGTRRRYDITAWLLKRGIEEGILKDNVNIVLVAAFVKEFVLHKEQLLDEVPVLYYGDFERDILFAYLKGISTNAGREIIEKEEVIYFEQMNNYGKEIPKFKF